MSHLITSTTVTAGDRIALGYGTLNLRVVEVAEVVTREWTQFGTVVAYVRLTDGERMTLWGAGTIYHRAHKAA